MHERPPDDDGAPRCTGAEVPGNVVVIYPRTDPNGAQLATQEKTAGALAVDPWLGIRERTLAVRAEYRLGRGLPLDPADRRDLTIVYEERRRQVVALWQAYR